MSKTLTRRGMIATSFAVAGGALTRRLAANPATPPKGSLRIQRLSWAGLRLEGPKTSLFIDPWISPGILGGSWTREIVPLAPSAKRRAILITHLHNDHFDLPAVKQLLTEGSQLYCLDRNAASVASKGIPVRPVELFHPEIYGDFAIMPVPAADGFGETQVSWIVRTDGVQLIHCGDTIWHSGFDMVGRAYGPFDYAFMPINGAVVERSVTAPPIPATLTPAEAVAAALLLRARMLVPIHYGLSDHEYHEFPNAVGTLTAVAKEYGLPIKVVAEGEWVVS